MFDYISVKTAAENGVFLNAVFRNYVSRNVLRVLYILVMPGLFLKMRKSQLMAD